MSAPLRVALAGYGLAGKVFHAPLIGATQGPSLHAVVSSDPTKLHTKHALAALAAGKHVVIDKPLAPCLDDARRIVAAAARAARPWRCSTPDQALAVMIVLDAGRTSARERREIALV